MKTLILAVLATSLFFSANSQAEWTQVAENTDNHKFYIDFSTIEYFPVEGLSLIYYTSMTSYLEPIYEEDMSYMQYEKVECETKRKSRIKTYGFGMPMAAGDPTRSFVSTSGWEVVLPSSVSEAKLLAVCKHVSDQISSAGRSRRQSR